MLKIVGLRLLKNRKRLLDSLEMHKFVPHEQSCIPVDN